MRKIITGTATAVFLLATLPALAIRDYTSRNNATNNWTAASSWTYVNDSGSPPATPPFSPMNSDYRAFIYGYTTLTGNLTMGGSAVINVYDTLVIRGNVTLGAGSRINVFNNGLLIIIGDVTMAGGFNIDNDNPAPNNGRVVMTGNFTASGGASITTNENFYVFDTTPSFTGGSSVNGQSTGSSAAELETEQDLADNDTALANFLTNDLGYSSSILPVELISFEARAEHNVIHVHWATASQLNFDFFALEHSLDGKAWRELDRIPGEGTTSEKRQYTYQITNAANGKNYFRLRMVDFDGTFEYSGVAAAVWQAENTFTIFPNPLTASQSLQYSLNFLPQPGDSIVIFDVQGAEMGRASVSGLTGKVDTISLLPGTYLVRLAGSHAAVLRLVVR
jgi:hypothetical protein